MRYCPHCHRLNPGRPAICHYCGRTWYVRLCPRHHENPPNAQYCGTCGSMDMTETAGLRSWVLYSVKLLIIIILFAGIFIIIRVFFLSFKGEHLTLIMNYVLALIFLIAAYGIALSVFPQLIKTIFMKMNRHFWKGITHLMFWFGRAIKEFINLILNW